MTENPSASRGAPWRALAAILALAACTPSTRDAPEVVIRGTDPSGTAQPGGPTGPGRPGLGVADARGVITYDGYQTAVARAGDTVASVADRVGLSASELAAYNGLRPTNPLRPGDELVLPPRPGGYGDPAAAALPGTAASDAGAIVSMPLDGDAAATVPPGDPAAGTPTWTPDLAAAAIERSVGLSADGTLGAPPSSVEPVPANPEPARELASPDLGQYQTAASDPAATAPPPPRPAAPEAPAPAPAAPAVPERMAAAEPAQPATTGRITRLRRPVQGPVAVGFNKGAGASRNDGVDFAVPAGSPVVAAADGEVALVSESLGGLGTIVLLRHSGDLLTVYGRIEGVTVRKGQYVKAGQQIGVVSNARAPAEPRMHFEVRQGAQSLDPMQFIDG